MVKILDDDAISSTNNSQAQISPEASSVELQNQLTQAFLTLPPQNLDLIVKKIMPFITAYELRQARIWGDRQRIKLGKVVNINDLLINTRSGDVTIDDDVFFGHRCQLLTGTHNYKKKGADRLNDVPSEGRDIHIKKGVWLGSSVTVLGPCVIGENAVIAAGSIVTVKEVPANTIWAGNPAKQVKEIEFEK